MDKDVETNPEPLVSEPQEASSTPVSDSMQSDGSDGAAAKGTIISGASISRNKLSSPPQGVVVVSQDPSARLTLWLPGQVQDSDHNQNTGSDSENNMTVQLQAGDAASNNLPKLKLSPTDQESLLNTPANKIRSSNLNFLTLIDWIISPQLQRAVTAQDSQRKTWLGKVGSLHTEAPHVVDVPLPHEMTVNVLNQNDFNLMSDELAQRQADTAVTPQEGINDGRLPVIRSKLEFSKGADGSQTLSYEEEVVKQQEGDGVIRRCGTDGIKRQKTRQKGLHLTFLDLLR